jgi:hypothetical protein
MVEYGALFDSSISEQLYETWLGICSFFNGVSIYWEIIAVVVILVLIRWMIRK